MTLIQAPMTSNLYVNTFIYIWNLLKTCCTSVGMLSIMIIIVGNVIGDQSLNTGQVNLCFPFMLIPLEKHGSIFLSLPSCW